jgi:hypothetical protein
MANVKQNCTTERWLMAIGLSLICSVAVANPPANDFEYQGRLQDYQRFNPGVPVWPSTCDCIRYSFQSSDSGVKKRTRLTIGLASSDYDYELLSSNDNKKPKPQVPMKSDASD